MIKLWSLGNRTQDTQFLIQWGCGGIIWLYWVQMLVALQPNQWLDILPCVNVHGLPKVRSVCSGNILISTCHLQWVYRMIKKHSLCLCCAFWKRKLHVTDGHHLSSWGRVVRLVFHDGHFLILRGRGIATNWAGLQHLSVESAHAITLNSST